MTGIRREKGGQKPLPVSCGALAGETEEGVSKD